MAPTNFKQANRTYNPPPGMANCEPLRTCDTGQYIVSCWRMTWRERLRVLITGKVWLCVFGRGQPPVFLDVESPCDKA